MSVRTSARNSPLRDSAQFCALLRLAFPVSDRNLGRTAGGPHGKRTQAEFAAVGGKSQANAQKEQRMKGMTSISLFASGLAGLAAVAIFGLSVVKAHGNDPNTLTVD